MAPSSHDLNPRDSIIDKLGDDKVIIPYQYSITSYGADYPVDALVKRMVDGAIFVPSFQRDYVWKLPQASRFIESLLLGLPVPGIFLALDAQTQKLAVLDGLQRLRTLQYFVEGIFAQTEKTFKLQQVQEQYRGLTFKELQEDDRLRIENAIIHATIVRQDQPEDDAEKTSIYHLFERINTGGTPLAPQEIRACLFFGKFVDLLSTLNTDDNWREVFGRPNKRMRDQELILRFFGLLYSSGVYKRPMKAFLNKALSHNRNFERVSGKRLTEDFCQAIAIAKEALGTRAFRPQRNFNAAVFDSVMVGLARRLEARGKPRAEYIRKRYDELMQDSAYIVAVTKSTADEEAVALRLRLATDAFA